MNERWHRLTADIRRHRAERPRFGHRRLAALLKADVWRVSKETLRKICRAEGLKVPQFKAQRHGPGHARGTELIAAGMNDVRRMIR